MNCQTIHDIRGNGCAQITRKTSSATSSSHPSEEQSNKEKPDLVFTNRGYRKFGAWSKAKLLEFITRKLKRCVEGQLNRTRHTDESIIEKRVWVTVHSGLYSTRVLKSLLKRGIFVHAIIKAMKLGLISLSSCELSYFRPFNIDPFMLEFEHTWSNKYNPELISNLRVIGISEPDCWCILLHGVDIQNACTLRHLLLSGIDIPGILNWQSPINQSTPKILLFLKNTGIETEIIQLVQQYGIDEETEQILVDIGLDQMEEKPSHEIICKCSLTALDLDNSNTDTMESESSSSTVYEKPRYIGYECQCGHPVGEITVDELTAQRNDYLRQNVMVPVAWAMSRALKYNPTDLLHYTAYSLLHWKYNLNRQKKESVGEAIAMATVAMDRKLIMEKNEKQKELIKNRYEEALSNIPCQRCKDRLDIIKPCTECTKVLVKKPGDCEFPEICSSCKLEASPKPCSFPEVCSFCKLASVPSRKSYRFPECSSTCKIMDNELKECQRDQLPRPCSSSKDADSAATRVEVCQHPELCSDCGMVDSISGEEMMFSSNAEDSV
ncbi:uncharacterized protein LOC144473598 [Augochlora pura]